MTSCPSGVRQGAARAAECGEERLLERAAARAVLLEGRLVEDDVEVDLLNGAAGGVVPLLGLAAATGRDRWLAAAAPIGRRLAGLARVDAGPVGVVHTLLRMHRSAALPDPLLLD
ncbi:hypothetical protein [Streptomyces sp. NPDC058145]|uniref:hypothetical protein n=1 Tax=Streptomyces sp. NPDC058145 TaxID=3346356 RepID=UPI0036ECD906